jgi:hypothetical protein
MAGIRDAMNDVMTQLATIQVENNEGAEITSPYIRIWNNQLRLNRDGKVEEFPKPAFFLEVISPAIYEVIGQGYRSADITFRIHIVHEYYNDDGDHGNGITFEQDLQVFDIRDAMITLMTYFTPSGCGPLTSVAENQDTDHDNLYHFIVDFVANFTDAKGSRLDTGRNYYVPSIPPTTLDLEIIPEETGEDTNLVEGIPQQPFIINDAKIKENQSFQILK